jgi:TolB-like protein
MPNEILEFLAFEVDRDTAELRCDGNPVTLEPKAFDLLCYLIAHRQRAVSKDELLETIWPGVVVSETALTSCVKKIRRAVADPADTQSVIKTVPRRGYRFVADIVSKSASPAAATSTLTVDVAPTDRPSLVVLPFTSPTGDDECELLADGLTEDIITELSRNGWLRVIARSTSSTYKGQTVNGRRVASELGVRYVAEGAVRRVDDQIRVAVHLVEADSETQRWSERYRRALSNVSSFQEQIATEIATALGSELRRAEGARARSVDPKALDAWGLVHRGMAVSWSTFNQKSNAEAAQYYRQAIALVPDDARAHAFLANSIAMRCVNGWSTNFKTDQSEAWQEIRLAMDLASGDPIVLGQLGHAHSCLGKPTMGVRLIERAIGLDPNAAANLGLISFSLIAVGRATEAIQRLDDILRRSPNDPAANWFHANAGWAHLQLEEFERCEEACLSSIACYDGWQAPWVTLAVARQMLNNQDDAVAALDSCRKLAPQIPFEGFEAFFRFVARDDSQGNLFADVLGTIWPEQQ